MKKYFLKKYDYSIKKQIFNPRKVYVSDLSLNSEIGFKFSKDEGRLLENLVFIELKRRGKEVYYHKQKKECDFVLKCGIKIVDAIQVTRSLFDINTKKREFGGLIEAMDSYDLNVGLILTENEERVEIIEGKKIIIMPIWKWLLDYSEE